MMNIAVNTGRPVGRDLIGQQQYAGKYKKKEENKGAVSQLTPQNEFKKKKNVVQLVLYFWCWYKTYKSTNEKFKRTHSEFQCILTDRQTAAAAAGEENRRVWYIKECGGGGDSRVDLSRSVLFFVVYHRNEKHFWKHTHTQKRNFCFYLSVRLLLLLFYFIQNTGPCVCLSVGRSMMVS